MLLLKYLLYNFLSMYLTTELPRPLLYTFQQLLKHTVKTISSQVKYKIKENKYLIAEKIHS